MASVHEVIEFLDIVSDKGFLNANTAGSRKTACKKLFGVLDDEQQTVEYVLGNIDVVKARFSNLNKSVSGNTVDMYGQRVLLALNGFLQWRDDRAGWEKSVSTKRSTRSVSGDKKTRSRAPRKQRKTPRAQEGAGRKIDSGQETQDRGVRLVKFPLRTDFELEVKLPRNGLTVAELQRVAYFLLPYTSDWEPTASPRDMFLKPAGD